MSEPQQGVPEQPPVDGAGAAPSADPGLVPPGYVPPGYATPGYVPPQSQWGGPVPPPSSAPWSALAVAGFIVAFFFSLVGLVLSIFGLRDTRIAGKRGRGLAIAGIVIGAVRFAIDLVLVIALVAALPGFITRAVESATGGSGNIADAASFGSGDDLPRGGEPVGMHQGLSSTGWTSSDDTPWTDAFVPLGHFTGLQDGEYPPSYDDTSGACTAYIDMYTEDVNDSSLYADSAQLLKYWIESDDSSKMTGSVTTGSAPAFRQSDAGHQSPAGSYDVVQSAFEDKAGSGGTGVAWARVFRTSEEEIGVVTSVICDGSGDIAEVGMPVLSQSIGGAW